MDRTDLIEQLVVVKDCGTAGEDDDAAASGLAKRCLSDALQPVVAQWTTSGPTGIMTRIKQAEDMTAPTIKRNAAR